MANQYTGVNEAAIGRKVGLRKLTKQLSYGVYETRTAKLFLLGCLTQVGDESVQPC